MQAATSAEGDRSAISKGWHARLRLGLRATPGRTLLAERERHGPLAVQRPFYPEGDVCHVYLLHPPGGVVGGDRLQILVDVGECAKALVTTPGATKFYRSAGLEASQVQRLSVAEGAALEWLPQESIHFPGAEVKLETRIDLCGNAACALWELHCFGRPVIGEVFDAGQVDSRLEIYREGLPLLLDRLRVHPDNRRRRSLMAGLAVCGTLVISGAGAREIAACRDLLGSDVAVSAGVTLIEDLLVLRYLGDSTELAHRLFRAAWQRLRPMTLGRAPSVPRIWAT